MLKKENKTRTCHPEFSLGFHEILSRGDTVGGNQVQHGNQGGRSTSSLSFPCLTQESTWCGLNASRFAQYA